MAGGEQCRKQRDAYCRRADLTAGATTYQYHTKHKHGARSNGAAGRARFQLNGHAQQQHPYELRCTEENVDIHICQVYTCVHGQ